VKKLIILSRMEKVQVKWKKFITKIKKIWNYRID
jgi:hypothetical protein